MTLESLEEATWIGSLQYRMFTPCPAPVPDDMPDDDRNKEGDESGANAPPISRSNNPTV